MRLTNASAQPLEAEVTTTNVAVSWATDQHLGKGTVAVEAERKVVNAHVLAKSLLVALVT